MPTLPTPVECISLDNRTLYIKRDDLYHPHLSGNKFRKLQTLIETPSGQYHRLQSFGGAQSNAMLALAALCREKGWAFRYLVKTLPPALQIPQGNLKTALELGMQLIQVDPDTYAARTRHWMAQTDPATLTLRKGVPTPSRKRASPHWPRRSARGPRTCIIFTSPCPPAPARRPPIWPRNFRSAGS